MIFFFSSLEAEKLRPFFFFPGEDKIIHLLEYALLGLLLMRCLVPWRGGVPAKGLSMFLGTLHGIGDEFHQSFVPGRESDINDILMDFLGAALASLLYEKFRKRSRHA
ncbi:MAG: VanZ family protein [Nitrospinae bacterium]|nr:VanZ family protein [Nitrospinota bacterium]